MVHFSKPKPSKFYIIFNLAVLFMSMRWQVLQSKMFTLNNYCRILVA